MCHVGACMHATRRLLTPQPKVEAPQNSALPSVQRTMPAGIPQAGPFDCPGEIATLDNEGYAEGEHPYIRMAAIVRARRLDLRLLLDSYDMHNRGFVDKNTFMRALCHSFGNQWNELQLTNAEFDECTKCGRARGARRLARTPNPSAAGRTNGPASPLRLSHGRSTRGCPLRPRVCDSPCVPPCQAVPLPRAEAARRPHRERVLAEICGPRAGPRRQVGLGRWHGQGGRLLSA